MSEESVIDLLFKVLAVIGGASGISRFLNWLKEKMKQKPDLKVIGMEVKEGDASGFNELFLKIKNRGCATAHNVGCLWWIYLLDKGQMTIHDSSQRRGTVEIVGIPPNLSYPYHSPIVRLKKDEMYELYVEIRFNGKTSTKIMKLEPPTKAVGLQK